MEPVKPRKLKLTFRDPTSDPITDVAESNTVHKPHSHFDDHEDEPENTGSWSSGKGSEEDDSEVGGSEGSSSDRRQAQLNCNSLTTADPGPIKSKVKKNLMFPSAGDMHSSIQQYMAYPKLRFPTITNNVMSSSSHQLLAELYGGARVKGFSISRDRAGRSIFDQNTASVTLSCYRGTGRHTARGKIGCPYFLTVGKVGPKFRITHSDLRHNHTLEPHDSLASPFPISGPVVSVPGSLGHRPSKRAQRQSEASSIRPQVVATLAPTSSSANLGVSVGMAIDYSAAEIRGSVEMAANPSAGKAGGSVGMVTDRSPVKVGGNVGMPGVKDVKKWDGAALEEEDESEKEFVEEYRAGNAVEYRVTPIVKSPTIHPNTLPPHQAPPLPAPTVPLFQPYFSTSTAPLFDPHFSSPMAPLPTSTAPLFDPHFSSPMAPLLETNRNVSASASTIPIPFVHAPVEVVRSASSSSYWDGSITSSSTSAAAAAAVVSNPIMEEPRRPAPLFRRHSQIKFIRLD